MPFWFMISFHRNALLSSSGGNHYSVDPNKEASSKLSKKKRKKEEREVNSIRNSGKITIWNTHAVASYRQIHGGFGVGCFMGREQEVGRV